MDKNAGKTGLSIWLAAFIDADGMIGIHKQPRNGNGQLVPYVKISTTCEKTHHFLGEALVELGVGHYWTKRAGQKQGWKEVWVLTVAGMKRCDKFLKLLLPYFVTKEEEAKIMLHFIDARLSSPMRRGYTPSQLAMVDRMKELKKLRNGNAKNGNATIVRESPETICQAPADAG